MSHEAEIAAGYYDITFPVDEWDEDAWREGPPTRTVTDCWRGARVLMRDGADLIIEHYPVGWRNVMRRIDRVTPEWAKSMTFTKIEGVPHGA